MRAWACVCAFVKLMTVLACLLISVYPAYFSLANVSRAHRRKVIHYIHVSSTLLADECNENLPPFLLFFFSHLISFIFIIFPRKELWNFWKVAKAAASYYLMLSEPLALLSNNCLVFISVVCVCFFSFLSIILRSCCVCFFASLLVSRIAKETFKIAYSTVGNAMFEIRKSTK